MDSTRRSKPAVPFSTIFCDSCRQGFPGICLIWSSIFFFIIPNAPTATGIAIAFKCHIFYISICKSLYLIIFSYSLSDRFISEGTVMSINKHVFFLQSFTIMSGRLAYIDLSVCIVRSQRIVPPLPSVTGAGWCSYQCSAYGALWC